MTAELDIGYLIDRSSFGTPRARALRARTTDEEADAVKILVKALLGLFVTAARDSGALAHIALDDQDPPSLGATMTYPPAPPPQPPAPQTPPMRELPTYPALRSDCNIQGNVLAAFNKDFELLLFLQFPDQRRGQQFIADLLPLVSSNADVAGFNAAFSEARRSAHEDPDDLSSTWLSVSLTPHGLETLSPGVDALLGQPQWDPTLARLLAGATTAPDVQSSGDEAPSSWFFGRPTQTIDVVVVLAADSASDLLGVAQEVKQIAAKHDVLSVFDQEGRVLPGSRHGHEHFGFKDGISQPGVIGFDQPDPTTPSQVAGKSGTRLVESGEFIFGYPGHDNPTGRPVPSWMFDGSILVIRRLAQDVPGWWAQAEQLAQELGLTSEALGAKLVGRWRSGVPVAVDPAADPRSGTDLSADNNFDYSDDPTGNSTPLCAHLRKTNPRAGTGPGQDEVDKHRILRRGIAFGAPFDPAAGKDHGPDASRGLVFACYQTSLGEQFEFVQSSWANAVDFPTAGSGPDPVIGPAGTGEAPVAGATKQLNFGRFVHVEGGLYAFTPSIPTLKMLAQGRALPNP